jgi:hypothetical protein
LVTQGNRRYSISAHLTSDLVYGLTHIHTDIQLDGVEFSALPSGLHLLERDVVYVRFKLDNSSLTPFAHSYFTTKDSHRGVCVFHRRPTSEQGQRGFRLSSLGILLARSLRPRPWRHLAALKALAQGIYGPLGQEEGRELREEDWAPARRFFDERRVRSTDLGGAGKWHRWSKEFDDRGDGVSFPSFLVPSSPHAGFV